MNQLRTRLILSSLAVVTVTVLVMAVLLALFLRNQPAAADPIFNRLATLARVLDEREVGRGMMFADSTVRRTQTLNQLASRSNSRILVLDAGNSVVYDSLDMIPAATTLAVTVWEPALPARDLLRGSFEYNGDQWLFIGREIDLRDSESAGLIALTERRPRSSAQEALGLFGPSLLQALLLAGLAGLVIAVLSAWLSSRGIVRGLGQLAAAARSVAGGDYRTRVQPQGPEEVQAVAAAFNHMTAQVEASRQSQQDFLANVTHDLRTPLTSIQGFSQAIIDGASQDPAHHARIIHDEAGRMNRMVDELLDLARISAGRMRMRQQQVNAGLIAGAVAERLAIKARQKGIQLVTDLQPIPDVAGDGDRLAQVFTNLIDNAIAFTPAGGTVRVAARAAEAGVEVTVSDTGQGIPAEDLPRVFERFYQADKARGPRRGTGLGLAIAAEIVQAHGGRISATSGGTGQGATFTVWLPAQG